MSEKEEDRIVQRSTQLAKAYFKEKLGYEFVVKNHEFSSRTNGRRSLSMAMKKEIKKIKFPQILIILERNMKFKW